MASKFSLVLLLATSLAFLLVTNATIIRTTVSEIEEENSRFGGESCSGKKLRDSGLNTCMKCMEHSGIRGGYETMGRPIRTFQCRNECCGMMDIMGRDCMCKALKNLSRECQSPSASYTEKMMCDREMMSKMMQLPRMCDSEMEACHYNWIMV